MPKRKRDEDPVDFVSRFGFARLDGTVALPAQQPAAVAVQELTNFVGSRPNALQASQQRLAFAGALLTCPGSVGMLAPDVMELVGLLATGVDYCALCAPPPVESLGSVVKKCPGYLAHTRGAQGTFTPRLHQDGTPFLHQDGTPRLRQMCDDCSVINRKNCTKHNHARASADQSARRAKRVAYEEATLGDEVDLSGERSPPHP